MKLFIYNFLVSYFFAVKVCMPSDYSPFIIDYDNFAAKKTYSIKEGDIKKGKEIFKSRKVNCLSCHEAPISEERFQGNFGPSLYGVGNKYTKDEIRIRVLDAKLINPESIMPSYFKILDYPRLPETYKGKTILSAEEVEHIVEFLYSLK